MAYELRDRITGELIAGVAAEALALAIVRRTLNTGAYRPTWELAATDPTGVRTIVAAGEELARRARGDSDQGRDDCDPAR